MTDSNTAAPRQFAADSKIRWSSEVTYYCSLCNGTHVAKLPMEDRLVWNGSPAINVPLGWSEWDKTFICGGCIAAIGKTIQELRQGDK